MAAVGPALLALDLSIALRGAILAALGFALLPALPVLLTAAERLAGVEAAGTSGSIIWLAGNLGAIAVSLVVQVLVHDPVAAFLVMAAVALLALPAARRFSVARWTLHARRGARIRPKTQTMPRTKSHTGHDQVLVRTATRSDEISAGQQT